MTIQKRSLTFLLALLSLHSAQTWAASSALNSLSVRGATLQAFTAVADDASAVFYNPAGLTQIKGTEIDGNLQLIFQDIKFVNKLNHVSSKSRKFVQSPSLFVSTDKIEGLSLGFGLYAPFGKKTVFKVNPAVDNLVQKSYSSRVDSVPTLAFKLNDCLSVGVGFVGSRMDIDMNILGLHNKAHGYGFSGQGGLLLKLHEDVKFGLTYRGPMTVDLKGKGDIASLNIVDNFKAKIHFPGIVSSGLAWQATNNWLFSLNYEYEMWSSVKEYRLNYSNNAFLNKNGIIPVAGKKSKNIRVGTLFKPCDKNEYRVGYSFVGAAIPAANILPAQPDVNFHAITVGYSHHIDSTVRLDVGYQCEIANKRDSNNARLPGRYSGPVHSVFLGAGYKFN